MADDRGDSEATASLPGEEGRTPDRRDNNDGGIPSPPAAKRLKADGAGDGKGNGVAPDDDANLASPATLGLDGGHQSAAFQSSLALIGPLGRDYVTNVMSTQGPAEAVRDIQSKTALADARCGPLFDLLRQMAKGRAETSRLLLESVIQVLLKRARAIDDEDILGELLDASFRFVNIPELKAVPMLALERMSRVPHMYLKQLSADGDIFAKCSPSVQRQVWELDKGKLQEHIRPLMHAYAQEQTTVESWLGMVTIHGPRGRQGPGGFMRPASKQGGRGGQASTASNTARQALRGASPALTKTFDVTQHSKKIYKTICALW